MLITESTQVIPSFVSLRYDVDIQWINLPRTRIAVAKLTSRP